MFRDNTERKKSDRALREALEDREILLRELHHRVKNNLQFMDSLIELQKRGEGSPAAAALAKMQSRIAALSAAYFVIAESPEDFRIDSRRYFASLCSLLHDEAEARGVKIDIVLDCGEVPIDLDSAVPIGLIVRELVINSALHGYGEGGGGKVEVSFLVAKNKAELRIRDYGAGRVSGIEDRLGLTVARALCLQLGGILEFSDAGPGLSAATSFLLA
jgi:two-component sensor histidine kinase